MSFSQPGFTNLHVHSHFSSLDGMPSPDAIAQRVASLGQESFAITDHGTLAGIPQAYRAAKKYGLGFMPGCEMYFTKDRKLKSKDRLGENYYHLILLAYNNEGYKNLVKMQSYAWDEGYYHKPRVDYEILDQFHDGIIATTACLGSLTSQLLLRDDYNGALKELGTLVDVFGEDNVYVELQRHGIAEQEKILYKQAQLAKDMQLPMIVTSDSHYCCPEDHDFHDSLLCTATKSKKADTKRFKFENSNFYLHSAEEMLEKFPQHEFPNAVTNTVELSRRSEFTMKIDDDKEYIMPRVNTKEGMSESETLRHHVFEGAADPERYGDEDGNIPQHVTDRLNYELDVIENMGFAGYFLIVERLIKLFAEHGIYTGAGRGSAAGSAAVYCLGITKIDPFEHKLFFERFLNPDRVSMPDIDIDIPQTKRQEALRLIEQEYGVGHVAHLSNYTMMAMRESLQRMGKVFGLSPSVSNKFTKEVAAFCDEKEMSLQEFVLHPIPQDILAATKIDTDTAYKIVKTASRLEGTLISYGVHASGIVVTDTPIHDNFPIRLSKNAPLPVCQYDGKDVEALGGVKLDMLGLVNLDQCEEAERNILLDLGIEVDTAKLPIDDPEVYETLSEGRGGGVFQLGCLAGNTIIDGETIADMYQRKHSTSKIHEVRSVFFGEGDVRKNLVRDVVFSGEKLTYTLRTSDEKTIRATKDHKFFTDSGWLALGDLQPGTHKVLSVQDEVGMFDIPAGVRGRKDIVNLVLHHQPHWKRMESSYPVTVNGETFYPTLQHRENDAQFLWIVNDESYEHAAVIADKINMLREPDDISLEVVSYSQVVEDVFAHNDGLTIDAMPLGIPLGTQWVDIEDISEYGYEPTYDVMMAAPAHNFIANGLMVHNSSGMRKLLRSMKPTEFSDISASLALYRPGPMGMGTHDEYCLRKNSESGFEALHEDMKDLLSDTYYLTVYQEDIMAMAKHYAGYTGAEADDLRKAVAKKNPEKMLQQKRKFIPAVNERFGNKLGEQLWDIIEPFGAYAFCKAHSVAYAATTYRTAWLKTHYTPQFAGAVLDHVLNVPDKLVSTIAWIRDEGVEIQPPDINASELRTITSETSITLPLDVVKGVGYNKAESFIEERQKHGAYTSVVDFAARNTVPQRMLEVLAKAGAFDSLGVNRAAVMKHSAAIMSLAKTQSSRSKVTQGLFGDVLNATIDETETLDLSYEPTEVHLEEDDAIVEVTPELYGRWERESIGILLGEHPYAEYRRAFEIIPGLERRYPPADSFTSPRKNVGFSGYITDIHNGTSSYGNPYSRFTIETDTGSIPGMLFKKHLPVEKAENVLMNITGSIGDDNDSGSGDFSPMAFCDNFKPVQMEKIRQRLKENA